MRPEGAGHRGGTALGSGKSEWKVVKDRKACMNQELKVGDGGWSMVSKAASCSQPAQLG